MPRAACRVGVLRGVRRRRVQLFTASTGQGVQGMLPDLGNIGVGHVTTVPPVAPLVAFDCGRVLFGGRVAKGEEEAQRRPEPEKKPGTISRHAAQLTCCGPVAGPV